MFAHTAEFPIASGAGRITRRAVSRNVLHVLIAAAVLFAYRTIVQSSEATAHNERITLPAGAVTDFALHTSHGGFYRANVIAATIQAGTAQRWVVRVEGRDHRRVAHADIRTRVSMPETGIESAMHPAARYIGRGEYQLDGVLFTRPGWWNVALVVDGRRGTDSVAFNVRIP